MSSDFWKGVGVTISALVALLVIPDVIQWIGANPVWGRLAYWVTTPLFSIYDIATVTVILLMLYLFIWMAAFGPRP